MNKSVIVLTSEVSLTSSFVFRWLPTHVPLLVFTLRQRIFDPVVF